MVEHKAQTRRLAKDLNAKHKIFVAKLEECYSYMDA
jgi:hypothetical protein